MQNRNIDEYIAGFVDGEGCFALSLRKDVRKERPGSPVYFHWKAMFAIELRSDDVSVLNLIHERFKCGSVTHIPKRNVVRFQVANLDDLNTIISPFFEAHTLIGKKQRDFNAWRKAVKILYEQKQGSAHVDSGNILKQLHEEMRAVKGLTRSEVF